MNLGIEAETSSLATLKIAEIFTSLQGEGDRIGVPSLFIRISGCNLRCIWCDTPYASWHPEGAIMSLSQILERVKESSAPDVVVTGGEPMLFDGIEPLIDGIKRLNRFVTVETAGTVYRDMPVDLMSISPKLANSIPFGDPKERQHRKIMEDRAALKSLVERYRCQIKFVVTPSPSDSSALKTDLSEIDALLNNLGVPADRIFLMPEGRSSDILWERARLLVPICLERGWRLAPRIQIDLFGDTKGT